MTWEYLYLKIVGHNRMLAEADNLLVTTSDGDWRGVRMPNGPATIILILNKLGAAGWEMVNSSSGGGTGVIPGASFEAMFKRQPPSRSPGA